MFSPLLLTIVSTTIIGGIVFIIFNLIFNSKLDGEDQQESNESVNNGSVDKPEETVPCQEITTSKPFEESNAKKSIELTPDSSPQNKVSTNETLNEESGQQIDDNHHKDLHFEEEIEANELTDERPIKRQVVDEIVDKDVFPTTTFEFKAESEQNIEQPIVQDQLIFKEEESEELTDRQDVEDIKLKDEFWELEDTQNLKHLNKSRPKKQKSRPSVKVVFTDETTDEQKMTEDPISKNARELVDTLFDNLDSDLDEYKSRTDSEISPKDDEVLDEEKVFESDVCETIEETIVKNDDSFEEIATGEYKKFDEFSDCFRTETRKHEISRKVYEISSVKSFEVTVDSSEPLDEQLFDKLWKDFDAKEAKTEVFEENYNKVTESEAIGIRRGDQKEMIPIRTNETISHTKSVSERSLSSSSLSKMSLEDLDLSLRSSKSRLSETIDTVTKPLLSSPTLFRRSIIQSDEEVADENGVNQSPNRIQLPLFGGSQSLLMKEMKEKEFRKTLKPFSDFTINDKNISNE